MTRRTNAQIAEDNARDQMFLDVTTLRNAARIMDEYGVPASANVLRVVADSIEEGKRVKGDARPN